MGQSEGRRWGMQWNTINIVIAVVVVIVLIFLILRLF